MKHNKDRLIKIAQENSIYFTSVSKWNKHAIENDLPRAMSFSYHFGSWNKAKKAINTDSITHSPFTLLFSKEQLVQIAKSNKMHFTKIREWNDYSEENNLPSANTFIYVFGSWKKAKKEIFSINYFYTADKLKEIAFNNQCSFTSISNWNKHAVKHNLPSSKYYERFFGSWNQAKIIIFDNISNSINEKPGPYTEDDLMEVAIKYKEQFSTKKNWDNFAREMKLPCAETFSKHFNGWNQCKQLVSLHK